MSIQKQTNLAYIYTCNRKYKQKYKSTSMNRCGSLAILFFYIGLTWSWLKLECLRMRSTLFTLYLNQFSLYWWQCCLNSQSILWSFSMVCFATPDLSTSLFWQFLLCSDNLILRVLPVSPPYEWLQSWQGMRCRWLLLYHLGLCVVWLCSEGIRLFCWSWSKHGFSP